MKGWKRILLVWAVVVAAAARVSMAATVCGKKGGKYDFSPLEAFELESKMDDYTYSLRTCGVSSQKCPNDLDVKQGMAAQTSPGRCYILGVEDAGVEWTEDTEKQTATLTASNGAGTDCPLGQPRKLNVVFTCDESQSKGDLKDTKFTAKYTGCEYTYDVPTCLACNKGCQSGGFGATVLVIFCITFGSYLVIGMAWNAFKLKKQGLEVLPNRDLWSKFFGYVKDGFVMTFLIVTCKFRQASYDDIGGDGKATSGFSKDNAYPTAETAGTPYAAEEL